MIRREYNAQAEQMVLKLLAGKELGWLTAVEFAREVQLNWRITARALQRLHQNGLVSRREITTVDSNHRKRLRREYKYTPPGGPMLMQFERFDPSAFRIVGIRVIKRF